MDFKERLAALVPRPRLHLVRFHGVLAPNAKLRALIVPRAPGSACPRHDCRTQRGADAAASGNNDPAWFFGITIQRGFSLRENYAGSLFYSHANVADASARRLVRGITWGTACDDGHAFTSPSGAYRPNAFGLHDMLGNVWEWTADCWNESHAGAPPDGRARQGGDCSHRVLRGGSWSILPVYARSANRGRGTSDSRDGYVGFRVARTL